MPIYEFKCKKCGEEFESLFMPSDTAAECPSCGELYAKEDRVEVSVSNFKLNFKNIAV